MKARSTWPTAFLLVFLGCGTGSIGPMGAGDNNPTSGGSGNSGGSGSNVGGSGGSGAASSGITVTLPDGGSYTPPTSGSTTSAGNPVVVQQTWRLTATEYANTINDLLGISPANQTVPLNTDSPAGEFSAGQGQSTSIAQEYHDSAVALATQAVANLTTLLQPAGCSISAGASCASSFINYIAPLAYRHGTVDPATITALNAVYTAVSTGTGGTPTLGIEAVLQEILQSPYFLYKLETEEQAEGVGKQVAVTNYSMANRLSYLLWGSMPDSTLFAAAQAGSLASPDQIEAQATRMISGTAAAKAHVGLANFYNQWMQTGDLTVTKNGNSTSITTQGTESATPLWDTTNLVATGESFASVYTPAVYQEILQSFDMQLEAALWAPSGALKTLYTGTTVYANADLAPIFGVQATGPTLQAVTLPTGSPRVGILSHPLIMAARVLNVSNPIYRGRFVWDRILCQPLLNPPAAVPPFTPPMAGESLRQDVERLTATGPDANEPTCTTVGALTLSDGKTACSPLGTNGMPLPCPSCHARINPVGFLYEDFDTIGDFRKFDDYGQPVDLTNITIVQSADQNINQPTADSIQFATRLAASDLPNTCLMSQLYQFMSHRADGTADYPVEAQLDSIFDASNQSLTPVLVGLTQTAVFLDRVNGQ